mgnify:FL=1
MFHATSVIMIKTIWQSTIIFAIIMARFVTPDDFKIPRSDIIHANSGLILQYKSSYRPANKVIAISTSIPMVADMCYLVPIAALKQIPRCNFTMNKINFMYRNIEFGKE